MHPIFIEIGPLTIHWYGVFVSIGFLFGFRLFQRRALKMGWNEKEISNLVFLLFIFGILGARLYYVIWNWNSYYKDHIQEVWMIHRGGLVFYGGFIAATLALWVWARKHKKSLRKTADALAPGLVLGHFFGRIGCFMNGCCYGTECSYFWAVRLNAPPEVVGLSVHPTQIYEAIGLLHIFFALWIIEKIVRYPGQVILSYGILYSIGRFMIEFFRGDVSHNFLGLTLAQILCIFLFLFSWLAAARLTFLSRMQIFEKKTKKL